MFNVAKFNPFGPTVQATTEIADIRVYPIKSCRGISVKKTTLTRQGLDFDRNWMFVDTSDNNRFMTIRQISELTLIDTAFGTCADPNHPGGKDDLMLIASVRGKPTARIEIPARPTQEYLKENTTLVNVTIWKDTTDGWMYSDEINSIFAEYLGKPIALVYKGPTPRNTQGNGAAKLIGREESINYPDMMPLQISNAQSIKDLNQKLKARGQDEITIEHFRPNIVIKGDESKVPAWSEDNWKTIRILNGPSQSGGLINFGPQALTVDVVCRCIRCQVPNVNPETGVKHPKEPWDTMMTYRRVDPGSKYKPVFGMLCCPREEGVVEVGMKFEIIEQTDNHMFISFNVGGPAKPGS